MSDSSGQVRELTAPSIALFLILYIYDCKPDIFAVPDVETKL
jgi:hypothetical protein